jgi:hypothetical protein
VLEFKEKNLKYKLPMGKEHLEPWHGILPGLHEATQQNTWLKKPLQVSKGAKRLGNV